MIHSIGPINVCTDFEINRYKIDKFRKHAKIACFLTSRDAKTVRRTSWGTSDRYFNQEHFKTQPEVSTTFSSKVMAQTMVFMFLVTLTLTFDLCYISFTRTGQDRMYRNLHAKFHKNPSGMRARPHTQARRHAHTHTECHSNRLANTFGTRLMMKTYM